MIKQFLIKSKLYWPAIPFCIVSFLFTHRIDAYVSSSLLPIIGITLLSLTVIVILVYIIFMPICFKAKFTFHSIGHLFIFEISCLLGFIGSSLDEMAGMMYFFILEGVAAFVVIGAIYLFIFHMITRKASNRKLESYPEN